MMHPMLEKARKEGAYTDAEVLRAVAKAVHDKTEFAASEVTDSSWPLTTEDVVLLKDGNDRAKLYGLAQDMVAEVTRELDLWKALSEAADYEYGDADEVGTRDMSKAVCRLCGCTFGSHRADSLDRNACPGHEGRMDWAQGPGTHFCGGDSLKEDDETAVAEAMGNEHE